MVFVMTQDRQKRIDGIAPISANLPIGDNLDGKKIEKFVPICSINRTADRVNPYEGGLVEIMGNLKKTLKKLPLKIGKLIYH